MSRQWLIPMAKFIVFVAIGISIIVLNEEMMHVLPWLVGGTMLFFAADGIGHWLVHRDREHLLEFADEIVLLIMAVTVFLVRNDLVKVCVIWAVWSILREAAEVAEVLEHYTQTSIVVIDLIESVVVIALSVTLILSPAEHAHAHVVLLGIELILEVLFPTMDQLIFLRKGDRIEKSSDR